MTEVLERSRACLLQSDSPVDVFSSFLDSLSDLFSFFISPSQLLASAFFVPEIQNRTNMAMSDNARLHLAKILYCAN